MSSQKTPDDKDLIKRSLYLVLPLIAVLAGTAYSIEQTVPPATLTVVTQSCVAGRAASEYLVTHYKAIESKTGSGIVVNKPASLIFSSLQPKKRHKILKQCGFDWLSQLSTWNLVIMRTGKQNLTAMVIDSRKFKNRTANKLVSFMGAYGGFYPKLTTKFASHSLFVGAYNLWNMSAKGWPAQPGNLVLLVNPTRLMLHASHKQSRPLS